MELDDLHAALGALAARVDDVSGDAWSVVRDRGRGRRRGRAGVTTGVTSAVLVVIVLTGVAIAGHDSSGGRIATGPAPSTRPTPTTAAVVCTDADLQAHGFAPMPVAERVTKTDVTTGGELEPPEPTGSPVTVSPATVWQRAKVALTPNAAYQLLLAVYTGPYPSRTPQPQVAEVLAWVVVRRHYPIDNRARPLVIAPGTGTGTVRPPPCFFGTRYDVYDARTGRHLATSVTS